MDTAGGPSTVGSDVTVPPDTLTARLHRHADGGRATSPTPSGDPGATNKTSTLTVLLDPVINEVDYSIPHSSGMDPNEFIELYNPWPNVDRARRPARRLHARDRQRQGRPRTPTTCRCSGMMAGGPATSSSAIRPPSPTSSASGWRTHHQRDRPGHQPADGWFFNSEPGRRRHLRRQRATDGQRVRLQAGDPGEHASPATPAPTASPRAPAVRHAAHRRQLDRTGSVKHGRVAHPHAQRAGHRRLHHRHQVHAHADPGRRRTVLYPT